MIKTSIIVLVFIMGASIRNRKIFNFVCYINGYKLTEEEKKNTPKELLPFIKIYSNLFFLLGFLLLAETFVVHYLNIFKHIYKTWFTFAIWGIIAIVVCYMNRNDISQYIKFWLKRKK